MDIRTSLAAAAYAQSQAAASLPRQGPGQDPAAGRAFEEAVRSFTETVERGEQMAQAAMTTGADPHALVTALAQTELAVQTAVTVRDRVVEAYQELLRMPV
ncbi:MAG: flagellar hook-basal body complex protein FliE [Pseudomonadota bacterium]